jgi:hypothetical protein
MFLSKEFNFTPDYINQMTDEIYNLYLDRLNDYYIMQTKENKQETISADEFEKKFDVKRGKI